MTKILTPKKREINETEEVVLPYVKCDICGNFTTTGLHQIRLKMIKPAYMKKVDGQWKRIPPVMKKVDVYMCTKCVKEGKKWRGTKPI